MASREVCVDAHRVRLAGTLDMPDVARGIVLFAHGSASSGHSPRNRQVATALNEAGMATFLFDLLTPEEQAEDGTTGHLRFNVDILATRLEIATEWAMGEPQLRGLPIGFFGASTGAAAALIAAARLDDLVDAVVSRGGRPDLAGPYLSRVSAPTLMVVGERDTPVIELNREAYVRMRCTRELIMVPRATHLFDEAGALEQVAALASGWYQQQFVGLAARLDHGARSPAYRPAAR
jgi:putative phosphoribosyl transferase